MYVKSKTRNRNEKKTQIANGSKEVRFMKIEKRRKPK